MESNGLFCFKFGSLKNYLITSLVSEIYFRFKFILLLQKSDFCEIWHQHKQLENGYLERGDTYLNSNLNPLKKNQFKRLKQQAKRYTPLEHHVNCPEDRTNQHENNYNLCDEKGYLLFNFKEKSIKTETIALSALLKGEKEIV